MIKSLAILTALAVLAGPASAAEETSASSVTVSLVGKDAATIRADIAKAARQACRDAASKSGSFQWPGAVADCRGRAIRDAEAYLSKATFAARPASNQLAQAR